MTSSPWTLPSVLNYYTLQKKLLLKSNVRKQKSTIKNGGKCSNRKKSKYKSWTNLLSAKKNIAGQVLTYNSKNFHWLNRTLDFERTMNGLGKPFRKKSNPKNRENSKNQSEIAACEQKTTSEKANFCSNTVFSLYFKFRAKKFHAAKPLAFSLHFLFRRDQNHYSNLTSNIMKMCEQILKIKTAPQYNSNSLNCKKNCRIPILLFES